MQNVLVDPNLYNQMTGQLQNSYTIKQSYPPRSPYGDLPEIPDNADAQQKYALQKQIDSAEILADNGWDITHLPEFNETPDQMAGNGYGTRTTSNPDYLIEEKVFDCITPEKNSFKKMRPSLVNKIGEKGQCNNLVINLDRVSKTPQEMLGYLQTNPIEGLEEVFIIKGREVIHFKFE